jgi:hypothetical protein
MRKARHEPAPDWVGHVDHDDRDRRSHPLRRQGPYGALGDEDIHVEPRQLGGEVIEPGARLHPPTALDHDVLPLDVARCTQPVAEWGHHEGARSHAAV